MKKIIKIVIIAIIVLGVGGALLGGSDDDSSTNKNDKTEEKQEISYTSYSINDMMDELDANALNASDKYKDQYVEITGKLSNIDSDGSYIDLDRTDDEFALISVQCYVKDDAQLDAIKKMSIGDTVTVQGKITDVGEILGYSLDIDAIK